MWSEPLISVHPPVLCGLKKVSKPFFICNFRARILAVTFGVNFNCSFKVCDVKFKKNCILVESLRELHCRAVAVQQDGPGSNPAWGQFRWGLFSL